MASIVLVDLFLGTFLDACRRSFSS